MKKIINELKGFLQSILQEIMKKKSYLEHQTLGRQFICTIVPATQLNILEIDGFQIINITLELQLTIVYSIYQHFYKTFSISPASIFSLCLTGENSMADFWSAIQLRLLHGIINRKLFTRPVVCGLRQQGI